MGKFIHTMTEGEMLNSDEILYTYQRTNSYGGTSNYAATRDGESVRLLSDLRIPLKPAIHST